MQEPLSIDEIILKSEIEMEVETEKERIARLDRVLFRPMLIVLLLAGGWFVGALLLWIARGARIP